MSIPTTPPDGVPVRWDETSWRDPRTGDWIEAERTDNGSVAIYVPADGEGVVTLTLNAELAANLSAWLSQAE